nr:esterase-like activity of phytase family protein [Rhodococcus triatomae]
MSEAAGRWAAAAVMAVLGAGLTGAAPAPAEASPTAPTAPTEFSVLCTPTDPALDELSGLVAAGGRLYAVGDSGSDEAVAVLGPDCAVQQWIPVPVDPYDVEDMARGGDGRLWLSDTGDNRRRRETVALIAMSTDGSGGGSLHRLTYPDGPHDAETVLLGPDDVPVIVTKTFGGPSGIYRPEGGLTVHELAEPGPTPLEKLGELDLTALPADSGPDPDPDPDPDAPVSVAESLSRAVFTGGAVSHDGSVAAVRSYSHVHLFDVRGTSVGQALTGLPTESLVLPHQPQGEAVAFTESGDLVIASEARGGPLPPLLVLPDAVDRVRDSGVPAEGPQTEGAPSPDLSPGLVAIGLAVGFALLGGGMLLLRGLRRK